MQERLNAVKRMQDYIDEHISEKITPAELARVSFFSPWYAARLFKDVTGCTPAGYARRLKLSKSALILKDDNCRIIDAALKVGYDSVDGYQRAFRREFGCNPREYAKRPVPLYLFNPYGIITKKENTDMDNVRNIFIQVVDKPERKVLIKRVKKATEYFAYCEEVGCDVWEQLTAMKSLCGEPVCLWLPEKYRKPDTSEYVQGVEVEADYDGEIPDGFDIIELPKAKYLMFQGEPFKEEDYEQAIDEVWKAMAKYNPAAIGYTYDEENPRIQLAPIGTRGYIELVAVKA